MSLLELVPVPSDALVTPVTFKVKKRNLRGLLADLDAKEDGSRELSGEWIVGRKTWQRMQKEWKASKSGSHPSRISSDTPMSQKRKELVVLYIHGGSFCPQSATYHESLIVLFVLLQVHTICQVPLPCALFLFPSPNIPIRACLVSFPLILILHED